MAILTTSNLLSEQRYDISDARRIESGVRNDFDTLTTAIITNTEQGYIVRGFSIITAGSVGSAANGLQMVVDPGAVLHIAASVSGTIFQTPIGTINQVLNAATNPNVTGSFTANSTNYVGIDYNRFADPSTDVTKYIWNASANDEITTIAPAAQTLTFKIVITSSVWAANILPVAIVTVGPTGNVVSITDARWMLCSLETGGISPNPNYTYPWSEGRVQPPITTISDAIDPFSGGDKQLTCLKDWMNAIMSEIGEIKGTPSWFSSLAPLSISNLLQDLGNTVITGPGEISNGILPNSDSILVTTGTIVSGSNQLTTLGSMVGLSNGDFIFGTGIPANTFIVSGGLYTFTVTSANATVGAIYSNNGQTFTVSTTIVAGTTLLTAGSGAPTASGTLTKVSGTGDSTIAFSAFVNTSSTLTMSQPATLNGVGIGITFYSPSVITAPGQINWNDPIYIRVIGSSLTYVLAANPSSADITLADDQVAYIVFGNNQPIAPNLIFVGGSPIINSVGAVSWTTGLLPGDYIKVATDTVSGYYEILTVNSLSQVTLGNPITLITTPVLPTDNYPGGTQAEFAFGSYLASPTPTTARNIYVTSRETVPANAYWLFLREDNGGTPRVYIRFMAEELDNGESVEVSGTTSLELLKYIGSLSASDSFPLYVAALNPGSLPQISGIVPTPGSGITGGEYFLINSSGTARQYAVWFKVNGVGTAPVVPFTNGLIEVDVLSTDTASQVAAKIDIALNSSPFGDFSAVFESNEYIFTTLSANATVGSTYTNNGNTFTTVNSISGGTTLISTGTGPPAFSGGSSFLNSASTYGILSAVAITNSVGTSIVNGNLGEYPGSTVTGAFTVSGATNLGNAAAQTAQTDALVGYTTLAAHPGYIVLSATTYDLETHGPYSAGYYSVGSSAAIARTGNGTVTLTGTATDVFVFKIGSTLTTGNTGGGIPTITLTGGALARNVYWLVGSSATINQNVVSAGSIFNGNIIAVASITVTQLSTINGSLIALGPSGSAVTISNISTINSQPGSSTGTLTKVTGGGDATITFSAFSNTPEIIVTNTSAGSTVASSAGTSPFTVTTIQTGTGLGNFIIHDGDSLTLAIKELDEAIGNIEASLNSPTYDEVIEIVASGGTYPPSLISPVSINGPISSGTVITLPLNSREGNSLAQYTIGKGTLLVFLNGQFLDLESGAYFEGNGIPSLGLPLGTPTNQIVIETNLVVGDELEFRFSGGGGSGGAQGPAGPAGATGPRGMDALAGPVAISTKIGPTTYNVLSGDCFLLANCAAGTVNFQLPTAASSTGNVFYFKKTDSSFNYMFILAAGLDLIDGFGMQMTNTQYNEFAVISDGLKWNIF